MDRDQLKEHLAFAAELGVAGVSRDQTWRTRTEQDVRPRSDPRPTSPHPPTEAPLTFSKNAAEAPVR